MPVRLGIFVSHPIQYHVPIWQRLAQTPGLEIMVHYFSDHSVRGGIDPGFGVEVAWDIPLLDGYPYTFVRRDADINLRRSFTLPNIRQCLKEGGFDCIFVAGYMYPFEWQLLTIAPLFGCKIIMRGEFTDLKPPDFPLWKKLVRKSLLTGLYSRVDAFGCVGQEARDHLLSAGVKPEQIFFSPYSVNDEEFIRQQAAFDRATSRQELGIDDDTFVFLFSGKLIPRKEILRLIEAFGLLPPALRSKAALLVVGDGEQRDIVCQKGRELLGKRFLFQGFVNQSQLGKYFVASDAFVLPSHYEAWGLVVNEAMVFGLPLLLSHMIGSRKDLLIEGETGYTFQAKDTASLAEALKRMMASPEHSREMGNRAREHISRYSIEASAQGVRDAIFSVCQ